MWNTAMTYWAQHVEHSVDKAMPAGGGTHRTVAARLARKEPSNFDRLVVIDTETTGLAGGTGTLPFLTGLFTCDVHSASLRQWLVTRFEGERHMLQALSDHLRPGDLLLSYNGKTFDLPLLLTRARLERVNLNLDAFEHLDLLHLVRRAFSRRWSDCKLQTAEKRLLHLQRHDDIAGADIPSVWFDWMRCGRSDGLTAVVRHNRLDLVNLAALVARLADVFEHPEKFGARVAATARYNGLDDKQVLGKLIAAGHQLDTGERFELARLARRVGCWEVAVEQWHQLAARGHAEAIEHLAKYHEHRQRDMHAALVQTTRLIELEGATPTHRHRKTRLLAKLAQHHG